jgi:hypothetical protein
MAPKQKYVYTRKTIIDQWASKFNSTRTWLSKLNGSKELRALDLFHFCNWTSKTPDELLAMKCSFENIDIEKLLDRFVMEASLPESLRFRTSIAVHSFFRWNYRQIQNESGKIEYVQKRPQRSPSQAQRLELFKACYNQRDRALICVSCCSAIALETMGKLRWFHFEQDWRQQDVPHISIPPEILKGHGKGRYRGVRQETFLTPEAKRELIKYREYMTKEFRYQWRETDFVFLSLEKNQEGAYLPLSYNGLGNAVLTVSQRAEVPFSIHDGRRIVETALENINTSRNWIQKVKGRKVRGEDAPYSKPAIEQLRQKYKETLSELEFLNITSPETTNEFESLKTQIAELQQRMENFITSGQIVSESDGTIKFVLPGRKGTKEETAKLLEKATQKT